MNLFAYGTLMCPDIMAEVSVPGLSQIPGILHGYKRWAVRGEEYPAIRAQSDARVNGVVYRDLPENVWERLDRFEGDMYFRRTLEIQTDDLGRTLAQTYVLRERFVHRLDDQEWDYAAFLSRGKARFRALYVGYDSLD